MPGADAALEPLSRGRGEGENMPRLAPEMTRAAALALIRRAFAAAGLDTPALDARILMASALGIDAVAIVARPDGLLGSEGAARLDAVVRRRIAREPVARILGEREFWGLPFALSADTLVPRPETETVVEAALARVPAPDAALRLLDLGTGSGCLLVALLAELPRATGVGLDRSVGALETARRNAARNGVGARARFAASDWAAGVEARFDLVVSNPPYLATSRIESLDPEVRRHDPAAALDGGADGLSAYRAIFQDARRILNRGGFLIVEIGFDQEEAVHALARGASLDPVGTVQDLAGRARAVVTRRSSTAADPSTSA